MFKENFKNSLFYHITLYPYLQFDDIYKFLYQSVGGNLHILNNKDYFIENIFKEIGIVQSKDFIYSNLDNIKDEPLIEFLRDDKKYVRVNLRPFVKNNYDIKSLIEACLQTAENIVESEDHLKENIKQVWDEFTLFVEEDKFYIECEDYCTKSPYLHDELKKKVKDFYYIGLSKDILREFNKFLKDKNYPLIHHSQQYTSLYKPAYRVTGYNIIKSKLKLDS